MAVIDSIGFAGTPGTVESSPLSLNDTISGTLVRTGILTSEPPVIASEWAHDVDIQIKELLLLVDGWDGGAAAAISSRAVALAREVASQAARAITGLVAPVVTPTVDGSVLLEWHEPLVHLELTVHAGGVRVFYEIGGPDSPDHWEGDIEDAPIHPAAFLHRYFR